MTRREPRKFANCDLNVNSLFPISRNQNKLPDPPVWNDPLDRQIRFLEHSNFIGLRMSFSPPEAT